MLVHSFACVALLFLPALLFQANEFIASAATVQPCARHRVISWPTIEAIAYGKTLTSTQCKSAC
jgi:hypothetical protein